MTSHINMDATSKCTLMSLVKLHFNVLNMVSHPLGFLFTLYQLSFELGTLLHLQKKMDTKVNDMYIF